jgi:hypothetical protein
MDSTTLSPRISGRSGVSRTEAVAGCQRVHCLALVTSANSSGAGTGIVTVVVTPGAELSVARAAARPAQGNAEGIDR